MLTTLLVRIDLRLTGWSLTCKAVGIPDLHSSHMGSINSEVTIIENPIEIPRATPGVRPYVSLWIKRNPNFDGFNPGELFIRYPDLAGQRDQCVLVCKSPLVRWQQFTRVKKRPKTSKQFPMNYHISPWSPRKNTHSIPLNHEISLNHKITYRIAMKFTTSRRDIYRIPMNCL